MEQNNASSIGTSYSISEHVQHNVSVSEKTLLRTLMTNAPIPMWLRWFLCMFWSPLIIVTSTQKNDYIQIKKSAKNLGSFDLALNFSDVWQNSQINLLYFFGHSNMTWSNLFSPKKSTSSVILLKIHQQIIESYFYHFWVLVHAQYNTSRIFQLYLLLQKVENENA